MRPSSGSLSLYNHSSYLPYLKLWNSGDRARGLAAYFARRDFFFPLTFRYSIQQTNEDLGKKIAKLCRGLFPVQLEVFTVGGRVMYPRIYLGAILGSWMESHPYHWPLTPISATSGQHWSKMRRTVDRVTIVPADYLELATLWIPKEIPCKQPYSIL